MKRTFIIIIVMALAIIGVTIIQVISLNNSYSIRKKRMIGYTEQIINNIERNIDNFAISDSTQLTINNIDSSSILNSIDTNALNNNLNLNTDDWDNNPGEAIEEIHNAIDMFLNVVKKTIKGDIKINLDTISYTIENQLTKNNITNYQYKIHYNGKIKSNCIDFIEGEIISKTIGNNDFLNPILIKINLTNLKTDILSEMKWILILPISLLLIIITSYFIIVKTILNQKKVNEIKNDFIDNITHELKTPISTISLAIEALQKFDALEDPNKTMRYLDMSKNANNRLSMLVDKILNITKYEQKNIELKKTMFNIIETLNEVCNSINIKLLQKNGVININSSNNSQLIFADKEHFTTVFFNIIDNAIKYSEENLIIDINITQNKELIFINISDNGFGIPNSHISKVFDKFHRVPNKNIHNIKGYGLGLSYVKSIIELHEGTIDLKSKLNQGTTFTIKIPNYEK